MSFTITVFHSVNGKMLNHIKKTLNVSTIKSSSTFIKETQKQVSVTLQY